MKRLAALRLDRRTPGGDDFRAHDVLRVVRDRTEGFLSPAQPAFAIVEVEPIHIALDREDHIQITIFIDVHEFRVQRVQLVRPRNMCSCCI